MDEKIHDFIALFDGDASKAKAALEQYVHAQEVSKPPVSYGEEIIRLDAVTKRYKLGKKTVDALRDVSLEIRQGEFVAITGTSGSGKSTLLQIIGCLDKPSSGLVTIGSQVASRLHDKERSLLRQSTIGFIFQSFYLQPFLRLADNVAVPAMFTRQKRTMVDRNVALLLDRVGLADRAHHYPKELSGGQIQRAAIARSLVNNPRIILADEPTGNLDSANSQAVIDLFRTIRDTLGTTIVVVTHDTSIARQADRIIELRDGAIV